MCEAIYAISAMYEIFGKRRSYEEEVEKRTLRIRFAEKTVEIPTMPLFGKRRCVFLHVQIRRLPQILTECFVFSK
jgi:hypothetical protein